MNNVSVQIWKAPQNDGIGVDYVLCSPGPIQSWSFGTKDGYDEIVNAQLWLNNHTQIRDWLPWSRSLLTGKEDLYTDYAPFTREHLKNNLMNMRESIINNKGGIFSAPNQTPDPVIHFSTMRSVYWNWK